MKEERFRITVKFGDLSTTAEVDESMIAFLKYYYEVELTTQSAWVEYYMDGNSLRMHCKYATRKYIHLAKSIHHTLAIYYGDCTFNNPISHDWHE